jgi:hypothetical protein
VIFSLPRHLRRKDLPSHFAYIEWFTPFRARDRLTGLWPVSRSTRRGNFNSEVVPLGDIVQSCHLAPLFGRHADHYWRADVMSRCQQFYLNPWLDVRTFVSHVTSPPPS